MVDIPASDKEVSEVETPPVDLAQPVTSVPSASKKVSDPLSKLNVAAELDVDPDYYVRNETWMNKSIPKPVVHPLVKDTLLKEDDRLGDGLFDELIMGSEAAVKTYNELSNLLTGTFADGMLKRRKLETEKQDITWEWLKGEHNIRGKDQLRVLEIDDELAKVQEMHPEGVSNFSYEVANAILQNGGTMTKGVAAGGVAAAATGGAVGFYTGNAPLGAKVAVDTFKMVLNGSMMYDNFKASVTEAYSSLDSIYDDKGKELPYDDKRRLALGIGALNASVDFLGDKVSLNRIPGLSKFLKKTPVSDLVLNPKNKAFRKTLLSIGEVMGAQGTTEGIQSVISKLGEALGQAEANGDDLTGMVDVLGNLEKTWKPALYEAAVGAVAGSVIHTALSPMAYKQNLGTNIEDRAGEFRRLVEAGKKEADIPEYLRPNTPEEWQSIADEKPYASDQQKVDKVNNLSERYKQAKSDMKFGEKVKELVKIYTGSPELGDAKLKEKVTTQLGKVLGLDVMYLDPVALGELRMDLSDDALKAKLDEMLGRNKEGLMLAPIPVPVVEFLKMTNMDKQKGQLLINAAMPTANSQIAERANYFIKGIDSVLKSASADPKLTFTQIADKVLDKVGDTDYSHVGNEADLLEIGEIPADVKDAFTDKQQIDTELALALAARKEFKDMVEERKGMVAELSGVMAARKLKAGLADSAIDIDNDENIKQVDLYADNKSNKDFLLFRINPDTLSPAQKEQYLKNPRLAKELNIFSKKGEDAQTVADSLEYESVDHFLTVMGETLTTPEAKLWNELLLKESTQDESTVEARKLRNKNREELTQKYFSETKKVLNNMTNHLVSFIEERQKSLGTKFTFSRPRIEVIDTNAQDAINASTVAEMGDVKRFMRAAKARQKEAFTAVMDGDYPRAMKAWEATLYAEAMHRHGSQAVRNRNYLSDRISGLKKEDNAAMFRSAGEQYVKAANYIIDLMLPNKNIKSTLEKNDFTAWRNSEMGKGNAVPPVPSRFHEGLDDVNNYTNYEIRGLIGSVNALYSLADFKTEMQVDQQGRRETLAVDKSVTKIIDKSVELGRPDNTPQPGAETKLKDAVYWYISGNTRIMTLARMLDGYKMDGETQKIIQNVSNNYDQFVVNFNAFHNSFADDITWFNNQKPGAKFEDMKLREFYVPELHGTKLTKDGNITEAQLFTALLNMGNEGNAKRLGNWGVDEGRFLRAIGQHLDDRHLQMAQKIWDYYDSYKPAIREANLKAYGSSDVKWVDARPLSVTLANGKTVELRGGYYPIVSEWINTDLRQKTTLGAVISGNQVGEYLKYGGFEDFTDTTHLQHRVEESSNPISLDPSHFVKRYKAMIYDTSLRESLMFGAKVFNHPDMRAQLLSFFGNTKDAESFGKFIEAVGAARNKEDYGSANKMISALEKNRTVYTIGKLAYKKLSLVNQMMSLALFPTMMEDKYGTMLVDVPTTIKDLMASPDLYAERLRFYSQYNPKIADSMNEFLDLYTGQIKFNEPLLFGKHGKPAGKLLRAASNAANATMEIGMIGIKHADILSQIITLETVYRKGRAGEITGIDPNNEAAILEFANKVVAERITGNSITQIADFQRNRLMKVALMTFMGGLNLTYNTIRENANMLTDSYNVDRKEQDPTVTGEVGYIKPGAKMRQDVFHNAMFVMASYAVLPTLLRAGAKWYDDDKVKEEDMYKDFLGNLMSPFPVFSGLGFHILNDKGDGRGFGKILPIVQQVEDFTDMATFYIQHLTRTNDKTWKKDKNYKGAVMQTTNFLGMPSDAVWNAFASPKASSQLKKNTRAVIRSLKDEYEKFMGDEAFGDLTPEQREDVEEIKGALMQLENGNTAPIEALNQQVEDYNTGKPAQLPAEDQKELDQDEINKEELDKEELEGATVDNIHKPESSDPNSVVLNGKPFENVVSKIKDDVKIPNTDLSLKDYLMSIKGIESFGGQADAKAKKSTALGVFQFIKSTWDYMIELDKKTESPTLTEAGRTDPDQQLRAVQILTNANVSVLKRKGVALTKENLYLAHMLGATQAAKLLSVPLDSAPADIMPEKVISNNANILDKPSVQEVIDAVKNKLLSGLKRSENIQNQITKVANKNNLTAKTNWQDTIVR